MKQDLNGLWQFKQADENDFFDAEVPSTNYQDLLRLNKIPDPFVKINEKDTLWVAEKDWVYKKIFMADAELFLCDKVYLCAERLDTICDVKLNGETIAHADNCHIRQRFDVTGKLQSGENSIEIYFYSPVNYVLQRYNSIKTPRNSNGMDGIVHIRKPHYHFGWDWGPVLPVSGISGDIYLSGCTVAEITDFAAKQKHHSDGAVTLTLSCKADVFSTKEISCEFAVSCPNGGTLSATGLLTDGEFIANIEIPNAELWWTRELSGKDVQPLYSVMAAIVAGGEIVAEKTMRIGLRTITLNREIDSYGKNFCFELNGVKIFAKGANYIPPDNLINRVTKADYDKLIDTALFSNMNMLRIWGGGYYGDDVFYDICDEKGILVWQDFAYACQAYPFFVPEFLFGVTREVDDVVKRLRHHASLAIWCGNNEIEQMSPAWFYMKEYIAWTEQYFYGLLPIQMKALDEQRPFTAGSPIGLDYLYGVERDNVGDTHLWQVWHGMQPLTYYRKRLTRFCSEYGFESLPPEKTIRAFADESNHSLNSEVFNAHQKCGSGNKKMQYYIGSRFRLPEKFTDYIYTSEVCQSECVRDAAEHWRRHKGQCNGALYWQLNDCWPACSWSSCDYYGRYKALQYTSRRFFAPVTVSIEDSDGGFYIYTLNDTSREINAHLEFKVCDYDGKVLLLRDSDVLLGAGECKNQLAAGMALVRNQNKHLRAYAVATLTENGAELGRATVLLRKEKNAKLPIPTITKTVEREHGKIKITLLSDKYAHFVRLENDAFDNVFSDNWFDLQPAEPKVITVDADINISAEDYAKTLNVFSAAELSKKGNALTDFFVRAAILLNPSNFFPRLIMWKVPKNIPLRIFKYFEEEERVKNNE